MIVPCLGSISQSLCWCERIKETSNLFAGHYNHLKITCYGIGTPDIVPHVGWVHGERAGRRMVDAETCVTPGTAVGLCCSGTTLVGTGRDFTKG